MLRAVMEGVSYSLQNCLGVFGEMGITANDMLACGGGGSSPFWRKMLADLYGCPVKTVSSKEGPALGVALLAGVGAGIYGSVQEACSAVIRVDKEVQPEQANHLRYQKVYQLYRQLYPSLKEQFENLSRLSD